MKQKHNLFVKYNHFVCLLCLCNEFQYTADLVLVWAKMKDDAENESNWPNLLMSNSSIEWIISFSMWFNCRYFSQDLTFFKVNQQVWKAAGALAFLPHKTTSLENVTDTSTVSFSSNPCTEDDMEWDVLLLTAHSLLEEMSVWSLPRAVVV